MERNGTVYVAADGKLLGSALLRRLHRAGRPCLPQDGCQGPRLSDRRQVDDFFRRHRPAYVIHAAGPSGGIYANQTRPADLCAENLAVTLHLTEAAHRHGVRRFLYLASSCCYPPNAPQPSSPEHLWSGPLETTNEAYAAAKLAGIALCRAYRRQFGDDFVVGIPANPYGLDDDLDAQQAHVISALLFRIHAAKEQGAPEVVMWGTGTPRREFIFADDLADACILVMNCERPPEIINLGSGESITIAELARLIAGVVGYGGRLLFDPSRPDGAPRKELDSRPLQTLGWRPTTSLQQGIAATYAWFLANSQPAREAHAGYPTVSRAVSHSPSGRGDRPGLSHRQDHEPDPSFDRAGGRGGGRVPGPAA